MKEIQGNLWNVECDLRVLTTNGIVRRDGACVMGRGCAYEAKKRFPGIEFRLGKLLREHGNRVMRLGRYGGTMICSFPVKHHWRQEADPALIRRSAEQLVAVADKFGHERILIPRPGCGNGKLSWADVRPILAEVLDARFSVITFPDSSRRSAGRGGRRSRRTVQDRAQGLRQPRRPRARKKPAAPPRRGVPLQSSGRRRDLTTGVNLASLWSRGDDGAGPRRLTQSRQQADIRESLAPPVLTVFEARKPPALAERINRLFGSNCASRMLVQEDHEAAKSLQVQNAPYESSGSRTAPDGRSTPVRLQLGSR